jgi:hypothetical protein
MAWTVAYNLSIITLFLLIELLLVAVAEKKLSFSLGEDKKREHKRQHTSGRKVASIFPKRPQRRPLKRAASFTSVPCSTGPYRTTLLPSS